MEGLGELGDIDVGIDLCGVDIGVSEHFLDDTQVSAIGEEMGCEGMPQSMRVERLSDSGEEARLCDHIPQLATVETTSLPGAQEDVGRAAVLVE